MLHFGAGAAQDSDTALRWNILWHVDVRFVEKEQWPVTWLPEKDSRRRRVVSVSISVSQQRESSDRISSQSRQWSTALRQQSRSAQDASGPERSRRSSDSVSFFIRERESPVSGTFFVFIGSSHMTRMVGRFLMARTVQQPLPNTFSMYLKYATVRSMGM